MSPHTADAALQFSLPSIAKDSSNEKRGLELVRPLAEVVCLVGLYFVEEVLCRYCLSFAGEASGALELISVIV